MHKRLESIFGWLNTTAGMRKTKLIVIAKKTDQTPLAGAAYNLERHGSPRSLVGRARTHGTRAP